MRLLIISTFLACAAGAPLEGVVQLLKKTTPATIAAAIPVAVSTDTPGDIQAAAIDAQVKAEDESRAVADQSREARELLTENPSEGIIEANDLAKEKSEQAFWNAEEQKWQALDAMMVAEAQAEAAAARTSYVPYVDPTISEYSTVEQAVPEIAVKTAVNPDQAPISGNKKAAVKTIEPETPITPDAMKPADIFQVESANLKAVAPVAPLLSNVGIQKSLFFHSFPQSPIFVAPLSISPLSYSQPFVAPVGYVPPSLKVVATPAIHPVHF